MKKIFFLINFFGVFGLGFLVMKSMILKFRIVSFNETVLLFLGSLIFLGILIWLNNKINMFIYENLKHQYKKEK